MEHSEYQTMFELESTYWWYVGRRWIISRMIARRSTSRHVYALDIGCGTGANLAMLQPFALTVAGVDISPLAISYCRQRGLDNISLIADAGELPYPDSSVNLITLLDVLEHIEDERTALREINRVLTDNGLLIITVPAYQFLWSEHDIALHHKRRYTKKRINALIRQQGFAIEKSSYIITFSFPIIVVYRVLKGMLNRLYHDTPKTSHVRVYRPLNNFFVTLLKIENCLLRITNLPFGTSIILAVRKSKNRI